MPLPHRSRREVSRRTVAGAVAAVNTIGDGDAVFLYPMCLSHFRGCLLCGINEFDGTGRTDVAALMTFLTAVAMFVAHDGLHEMEQVGGSAQDVVRTF